MMGCAIDEARKIPSSLALRTTGNRNLHFTRWWALQNMAKTLCLEWKEKEWEGLMEEAIEAVAGLEDLREQDQALQEIAKTFQQFGLPERARDVELKRVK